MDECPAHWKIDLYWLSITTISYIYISFILAHYCVICACILPWNISQLSQLLYNTIMKIKISNGSLLDKRSILQLKQMHMKDSDKVKNVNREISALDPLCQTLYDKYGSEVEQLYDELLQINGKMWDIEQSIRDCERDQCFDSRFVELARSVYKTNADRHRVRNKINLVTKSNLPEVSRSI